VQTTLDLGLTSCIVGLGKDGVHLPDGEMLSWEAVEEICGVENSCFRLEAGELYRIQYFSEKFDRLYSLMPTSLAPTMLVSGIPMHRIKDTDPYHDTLEKIRSVKPVVGYVLDTATGLGYTAIEAAKTAEKVTTIELDEAALEIARQNPWSRALFENPKIQQRLGDSFEVVQDLKTGSYTRILHDPPAFSLAGDLYSGEFYQQLYRLLRNGGRLFHYVGDPQSKSGRSNTAGVIRRLEQAGFRQVHRAPRAFGVTAVK
jgi:predicted methyltransferase